MRTFDLWSAFLDTSCMARVTNEQVADRIGVTDSYVSYLRNGKRKPSGDVLVNLILEFKLDPVAAIDAFHKGEEDFGKFLRDNIFTEEQPSEHQIEPIK